jgi:methyl coenzyme M reductase subunit C
MGMMGGERQRGANSETDRATLMAQMKAMSTGEETITIPVGIKMLKAGTDNPRSMVEANISDVTADKMITVWLDSSVTDKKVASFVLIN